MSGELHSNFCPNCFAQPGQRCTVPTDGGRIEVTREHYARRDARADVVTDNKCDNPPKSIPEDQVDAISVIDKTLDNIEGLDADWTSPEVTELLEDLRDRIVRGYIAPTAVAPQEPSEDHPDGASDEREYNELSMLEGWLREPGREHHFYADRIAIAVGELKALRRIVDSDPAPSPDREKLIERVRLDLHRVMASQWAVVASALKMDQGQYDSFLSDLTAAALAAPVAVDEAKLAEVIRDCETPRLGGHVGPVRWEHKADAKTISDRRAEWLGGGEQ